MTGTRAARAAARERAWALAGENAPGADGGLVTAERWPRAADITAAITRLQAIPSG